MATKTETPDIEKTDSGEPEEAQELNAKDFAEMAEGDLDTFIGEAASDDEDGTDPSGPEPKATEEAGSESANTQTVDDSLEPEATDTQDEDPVGDADILAEYGLDNYRTLEDQLRGHSELRKKLSQRDEYAEVGRQVAPYMDQFRHWMESQGQAAQQQESAWAPPVERDATISQIEAAIKTAGSDPTAIQNLRQSVGEEAWKKWEEYSQYRRNWFDENLFNDPSQFVEHLVVPRVQQAIEERFGQHRMELEAQQTVGQIQDILDNEPARNILQNLLQIGTPQEVAISHTRLLMERAKHGEAQQEVSRKQKALDQKRDQLRRRNGKRAGKNPTGSGLQKELSGLRRDEVLQKLADMDDAGVLPD